MLVKGERSHMAVSFFINDFLKTNIPLNAGKSESPNLQSFVKQQFPGINLTCSVWDTNAATFDMHVDISVHILRA